MSNPGSPRPISAALMCLLFAISAVAHVVRAAGTTLPPLPSLELTHENQLQPVFGLRPYVDALAKDIAAARKSVYLDYYVLGGQIGREVAELLTKKRDEGLDVRILLDRHFGIIGKPRSEVKQVKRFLDENNAPYRLGVSRPGGLIVHRWTEDHNKLALIDGEIAYVGGTNIADVFLQYNDLMIRVQGPVVAEIERQFRFDWEIAGRPALARTVTTDTTYPGQGLPQSQSSAGSSTVRLVGTGIGRKSFEGALLNAIDSSRQRIRVQLHQLNHDPVLDALIRARERGVVVQVLLDPSNFDNLVPLIQRGPRGVLNSYAVNRLRVAKVDVRFVTLDDFEAYHMKLGLFDHEVALVGTGNWDYLATQTATETVLEVAGGPSVQEIGAWFDRTWETRSEEPRFGFIAQILNYLYRLLN